MALSILPPKEKALDPYIGPRAFERDNHDQRRFFGRDNETDEIVSLIYSHQLVLVYARSGAGKTSIFNAQVIPTLEKSGAQVLPVARIGIGSAIRETSRSNTYPATIKNSNETSNTETPFIENHYIFNMLQSLKRGVPPESLARESVSGFLSRHFPMNTDERGNTKLQVLIVDQLEEFFNFYPNNKWHEQQEGFFNQIAGLLNKNAAFRVVFVIREDYLARLDPFKEILPDNLRTRFRLERLSENGALSAIYGPLENISGVNIEDLKDEIQNIIKELLKVRVERFDDGKKRFDEIEGEFIEPIHLQVVCQRWWRERQHISIKNRTFLSNVDKALEDFYVEAIREAASSTKVSERAIRDWCGKKLITSSGTRGIVFQDQNLTEGMPNNVIDILDHKYLIRPELRSGSVWYELTHDRLIKPIKDSNETWYREKNEKRIRRLKIIAVPTAAAIIITALILYFYLIPPPTPVALSQQINATINTPVNITLHGSSPNKGEKLKYFIVSYPLNGFLKKGYGNITMPLAYTPSHRFTGNDTFVFKVGNDKSNSTNNATVTIMVRNIPLKVINQTVQVESDKAVRINLIDMDYPEYTHFRDAHTIPYDILNGPYHGYVSLEASSGVAIYTPHKGYAGPDFFVFRPNNTDVHGSNNDRSASIGVVYMNVSAFPQYYGYLVMEKGLTQGTIYPIYSSTVFVGRATIKDIPGIPVIDSLLDRTVSRWHTKIFLSANGTFFLEDLGSTNGTYVRGQLHSPLLNNARVVLRDGDIFRIGGTEIKFKSNIYPGK
jgi:FHA domain